MISDAASSPAPFSPFSTNSVISDTSDEIPDLGAFASIFRALTSLQPKTSGRALRASNTARSQQSTLRPDSETRSTTTTTYGLPSSYDTEDASDDVDDEESSVTSETETDEGQVPIKELQIPTDDDEPVSNNDDSDQPTLGVFDEALGFLAAERSRLASARNAGQRGADLIAHEETSSALRKRKRKKASRSVPVTCVLPGSVESHRTPDYESSSPERQPAPVARTHSDDKPHFSARNRSQKRNDLIFRIRTTTHAPIHSITTVIDSSPATPVHPRIAQLRSLNTKLRELFPQERRLDQEPQSVIPRLANQHDTLIHVFIDHSNILIGFLNFIRRRPSSPVPKQKQKHISHAALAYILERDRPITRRVLATSSPLYQPIESAEELGYEVRVYARVPDLGDGQDRIAKRLSAGSGTKKSHARSPSHGGGFTSGGNSTESDAGALRMSSSFPRATNAFPHSLTRGVQSAHLGTPGSSKPQSASGSGSGTPNTSATTRVRYREQGVDELLQLKLHQAIAAIDIPPPGATIVLATGDGNVGQFNDDGFLGPVRTALKKGWKVELYAWEDGLSKAWAREFSQGVFKAQFRIVFMETFGVDLLELEEA